MPGADISMLPTTFEPDVEARAARLEHQLAGMRLQLERRIDEAETAREEAASQRRMAEELGLAAAHFRTELEAVRAELAALEATVTFRVAKVPRRLYGRLRSMRSLR